MDGCQSLICISKAPAQPELAFLLRTLLGLSAHCHSFIWETFTEHLSRADTELGPGDTRRLTRRWIDVHLSCLQVEKESAL